MTDSVVFQIQQDKYLFGLSEPHREKNLLVRSYADDVEKEIKLLNTGVTVQLTVLPEIYNTKGAN